MSLNKFMKFANTKGDAFSLLVDRYEFPGEEFGPTDDNPADEFETGRFIVVSHAIRHNGREWNTCGPTMKTTELKRLKDWFALIQDGSATTGGLCFTERELEFTYDKVSGNLQVHLFFGFLPPWEDSSDSVVIGFQAEKLDIGAAINSLHAQLKAFPSRPPIGNAT